MRVGSRILPKMSGDWKGSAVGSAIGSACYPEPLRQSARDIAARSAAPTMTQERRIGMLALLLHEARDLINEAYVVEVDNEGPWQHAMEATGEEIRDALVGAQAMVLEMGKARRGES